MPPRAEDLPGWLKAVVLANPQRVDHEAIARQFLDELPTAETVRLDYEMRWRHTWWVGSWDNIDIAEAVQLMKESTDALTVAAGLSMHRNGRIRKAAVVALGRLDDARAIRWLVLRCGDWAHQVRSAALRVTTRHVVPANAEILVEILPLLDGGRFQRGGETTELRAQVLEALGDPASVHAVESAVRSPDRRVRRACVRMLVERGATVELLAEVVETSDVVAIAMVAGALPTNDGPINRRVGDILVSSSLPRFRAEGYWRLTKAAQSDSEDLIDSALRDPAPSVRGVARRWLSDRGQNANEIYRSLDAGQMLVVLRGLADRPEAQDADLARRHINDQKPAIRVAALRLLAGLGSTEDGQLFADRFTAGNGKERSHALAGLRRLGVGSFVDEMWHDARHDPSLAIRVLERVVVHANRWQRLDIALQATASEDLRLSRAGLESLRRVLAGWNRGYVGAPTEPGVLLERLEAARPAFLRVNNGKSETALYDHLESLLRRFN